MPCAKACATIIVTMPGNALSNRDHLNDCGFSTSTLANKQLYQKNKKKKLMCIYGLHKLICAIGFEREKIFLFLLTGLRGLLVSLQGAS